MSRKEDLTCHVICLLVLTMALWLAMGCPCHCEQRVTNLEVEILPGPVNVKAKYKSSGIEQYDGRPRYYGEITTSVAAGDQEYTVSYWPISVYSPDEAIEQVRKGVGWKDDYLFVPSSCGSGNAFNCDTEHVFAMRDGALVKIGEFVGNFNFRAPAPGRTYGAGHFYDIYVVGHPYLPRAELPIYSIAMKDENGRLVPDVEWAWENNFKEYGRRFENIQRHIDQQGANKAKWRDVLPDLLYCGGLANYCERQPELDLIMERAKALLPSEVFDGLKPTIDSVVPGVSPYDWQ